MSETADQQTKLYAALSKALGEMTEPKTTEQGYNYQYAPLHQVTKIVRPILAKYGLAILQFPFKEIDDNNDVSVGVETMVVHEDGGQISRSVSIPISNLVQKANAAQQMGAATTYLRRYSLMAVVGIAPEDDDAASLTENKKKPVKKPNYPAHPKKYSFEKKEESEDPPTMTTDKQIELIQKLLIDKGRTEKKIYETYKVDQLEDLTKLQASKTINSLMKLPDATVH